MLALAEKELKKNLSKALKWKVRPLWALNETCNAAFYV